MSFALRSLFAVAAVFAVAAPMSAQELEVEAFGDSQVQVVSAEHAPAALLAPTAAGVALMIPSASATFDAGSAAMIVRQRTSHNVALMIVGGAGLIVGSIVEGDAGTVIMIGGGVVGLIGLYRYLQ